MLMTALLFKISLLCLVNCFSPIGNHPDYNSRTHTTITFKSVARAVAQYLVNEGIIQDTGQSPTQILSEFFGPDGSALVAFYRTVMGDFGLKFTSLEKAEQSVYHVIAEQIDEAHKHIQNQRSVLNQLAQKSDPDITLMREIVAECLYVIQEFYSNTNWVEMNGNNYCSVLGVEGKQMPKVSDSTEHTCSGCNDDTQSIESGSCANNLLVSNQLTSGYRSGQDKRKPTGKCSHGGINDDSRKEAPRGGINKERNNPAYSPHYTLHDTAVAAAEEASYQFLINPDFGIMNGIEKSLNRQIFNIKSKTSLAFAVDVTGSMRDDIAQVIDATVSIVQQIQGTTNEPENYVLATFSDPESLTEAYKTTNASTMIRWLRQLNVGGGGDCPEYSMSGILKAIEFSNFDSEIHIFTDAGAKDASLFSKVKDEADAKGIKLSHHNLPCGCCSLTYYRKKRDVKERIKRSATTIYNALATATGGRSYGSSNTSLLDSLTEALEGAYLPSSTVMIDNVVINSSRTTPYSFPVDSTITSITLTLQTDSHTAYIPLDIHKPSGSLESFTSGSAQKISSSNGKTVLKITNPDNGIWTLSPKTVPQVTVEINAESQLQVDFHLMKSNNDGTSLMVSGNPVIDVNYSALILVYESTPVTNITDVILSNEFGDVIATHLTLNITTDFPTSFLANSILMTSATKRLKIEGIDSSGYAFRRDINSVVNVVEVELTDLFFSVRSNSGKLEMTLKNHGPSDLILNITVSGDTHRIINESSIQLTLTSQASSDCYFSVNTTENDTVLTFIVSVASDAGVVAQKSIKKISTAMEFPTLITADDQREDASHMLKETQNFVATIIGCVAGFVLALLVVGVFFMAKKYGCKIGGKKMVNPTNNNVPNNISQKSSHIHFDAFNTEQPVIRSKPPMATCKIISLNDIL